MYEFSAIGAWSRGIGFLKARPRDYLILIGGLGLLIPIAVQIAVQYALTGALFDGTPRPSDAGVVYQLAPLILVLVQAIGFFASWRLGLAERETLSGALLYGLLASLLAALIGIVLLSMAGMAASQAGSPAFVLFVILFTAVPIILLFAMFSTLAAAMVGAGMALVLAVMMVIGGATGNVGIAATMFGGGSGFVVVLFLLLSILLLWLATRLSCVTAVMADRKSYNIIAAVRISWEVTASDQWPIMRYLALVGVTLIVVLVGSFVAIGGGAAALQADASLVPQAVGLAVGLVFASLFVCLAVSVPAGIFLQMMGERAPVDVFA